MPSYDSFMCPNCGLFSLVVFTLAIALCAPSVHAQQATADDKYAPLPSQIVSAKTVFLMNETGKAKFGDAVYKQIKTWNRWQIIADKNQADLVLGARLKIDVLRTDSSREAPI